MSGTQYRGELEERVKNILRETCSSPEIILFIDEIHTIVGTGEVSSGSLDIANMFKPALSRGKLRCIGATTISEYRQYIEKDPALERRFEMIIVNEPSRDDTIEILRGLRSKLEMHHSVQISDLAIEAAVDLSIRFDIDHYLPDKAVDLLDKAGARTRLPALSIQDPLQQSGTGKLEVDKFTIAQVLAEKTGIPIEIVGEGVAELEQNRLLKLESILRAKVIGQDDAIARVSQRLKLSFAGISKRNGPLATFLFIGPSGVGKTELAKVLAEYLFGSQNAMIRLDMSEYKEEHSIARLIGSPPGYVGHDEEGQLTGLLRTKPFSIVLLDEADKAHPRVFDIFLQVFDDGRLTDGKGRTVNAKNAIFILTMNTSADQQNTSSGTGLKERFRIEFLNRIDEIIEFEHLDDKDIRSILRLMFVEIQSSIREKYQVEIQMSEEAEWYLAWTGYSQEYGARELRRTLERLVEIPLSQLVLKGKLNSYPQWIVDYQGDQIVLLHNEKMLSQE
jgi:ATP-dependent Clp protease ATP-binding subunit ClpC